MSVKILSTLRGGREVDDAVVKRTPEQADHADEHEPKVRRDDCKVYDLSGYVYDPKATKETK